MAIDDRIKLLTERQGRETEQSIWEGVGQKAKPKMLVVPTRKRSVSCYRTVGPGGKKTAWKTNLKWIKEANGEAGAT